VRVGTAAAIARGTIHRPPYAQTVAANGSWRIVAETSSATFGEQLRRLREAAKLTQEELAGRAGLTAKGIAALERGRRQRPYPHTVAALADALELTGAERERFVGALQGRTKTAGPVSSARPALPTPPTPLIDRQGEIQTLIALLSGGQRLVTLLGPGGVGKTRLAIEVATRVAPRFADGAAFAPLGQLDDPSLVLPAVAAALGLRETGGQPTREFVRACLHERQLLLILDNCEHVLAAAPEVAELLAACPDLTILATSRAPLRLRGEHEWAVSPLPPPDLSRLPTVADITENPAVTLFVARAREVAPDFALTQPNAAAVAAICRRLDGLPLALELAAAKIRLLNPTELLARLDRALPLLSGGPRDLPARQRTMRDAIAWSYDLLSAEEQRLFRRLGAFAGGWDLAAAEAVDNGQEAASDPQFNAYSPTATDTLGSLAALVEQSLVVAEKREDGTTRYRMLAAVREFAREQLEAQGEGDEARRCHAEHFLALAERAGQELSGPEQATWLELLEREHDNVRMAISWALATDRLDLVVRFGWALHIFWAMRGYHREGRRWMEAALAGGTLTGGEEARALAAAGLLARMQGDYSVATTRLQAALDRFRDLGDQPSVLVTLSRLGHAARLAGEYERAKRLAEEGLALARELGDRARTVWMLDVLGLVALAEGEYGRATTIFAEALPLAEETGDLRYLSGLRTNLAMAALGAGDHARTADCARAGLELGATIALPRGIAYALDLLACVAVAGGKPVRAARLFGAAEALREVNGLAQWSLAEQAVYGRYLPPLREALGEAEFAEAWSAGRGMTMESAVQLGMAERSPEPPGMADRQP
jgi:predicted ATPase/transcriptional regulator with XRE-family HTH domain